MLDAPTSLCPLFHSEVRKRAIYVPIPILPLTLTTISTTPACASALATLLLVPKEQPRGTLRECMERHPCVLPCKNKERHARRILRGAEEWVCCL